MGTATKQQEVKRPRGVQIANPAILDVIMEAVRLGFGRNPTEAAENLVNSGFGVLKDRQPTQVGAQK